MQACSPHPGARWSQHNCWSPVLFPVLEQAPNPAHVVIKAWHEHPAAQLSYLPILLAWDPWRRQWPHTTHSEASLLAQTLVSFTEFTSRAELWAVWVGPACHRCFPELSYQTSTLSQNKYYFSHVLQTGLIMPFLCIVTYLGLACYTAIL